MGWDGCYSWKSKADVVLDMVRSLESSGYKVVAEGMGRDAWYAAVERDGGRLGVVVLIKKQGNCFMRKDMDETCHPYYYAVPAKVKAALKGRSRPDTDWSPMMIESSNKWRENVGI